MSWQYSLQLVGLVFRLLLVAYSNDESRWYTYDCGTNSVRATTAGCRCPAAGAARSTTGHVSITTGLTEDDSVGATESDAEPTDAGYGCL